MFFSLFNFLSFGFLIPPLESLFNVWKRQKGNGWSVFYSIKRHTHTHTHTTVCQRFVGPSAGKSERWKTPEYISCRSGCSQIQGKVHTIRRSKCGRSKADFATVRALNFRQSDRLYVQKISRIHQFSLFSSELKGFFEKNQTHSGVKVFKAFARRRIHHTTMWIICSKIIPSGLWIGSLIRRSGPARSALWKMDYCV